MKALNSIRTTFGSIVGAIMEVKYNTQINSFNKYH